MQRLSAEQAQRAAELPGCRRMRDNVWNIPEDCFGLVGLGEWTPDPSLSADARALPQWERLRKNQQLDVAFALEHGGALIAHGTSAGKTFVGLSVAAARKGPALIIAPALASQTWVTEARKWYQKKLRRCRGQTPDDLSEDRYGSPWFLVNYEVLAHWGNALSAIPWATIVLDEAHELRGRSTTRMQGFKRALTFSRPVVVALTATPIWNRVDGLWALIDAVHPGWYGSYWQFAQRYVGAHEALTPNGKTIWELGRATNGDELAIRLKHVMRRLSKAELLPDLGALVRRSYAIENDAVAQKLSQAMQAFGKDELSAQEQRKLMHAALLKATAAKIKVLPDLMSGFSGRALVTAQTKESAQKAYEKLKEKATTFYFDGEVDREKREEIVKAAGKCPGPVFVCCTAQSVQQSIDCAVLDTIVVLELPWTVESALQVEGRIHRVTMQGEWATVIYVVIGNSFDQHCLAMLLEKLEDRGSVVGLDGMDQDLRDLLIQPDVDRILERHGLSRNAA